MKKAAVAFRWTAGCLAACCLVGAVGCRNQCGPNSPPWRPWGQLSQAPIIPPPGTNTLRMPGAGGGYYNQNATAANPNSGNWLPAGNSVNAGGATGGGAQPNPSGNSNLGPNGSPLSSAPFNNNSSNNNNTMPGTAWGSGTAYPTSYQTAGTQMISPNFNSTRIDERRDSTRMPVADASQVRATSPFQPGFQPRVAQNNPASGYGYNGTIAGPITQGPQWSPGSFRSNGSPQPGWGNPAGYGQTGPSVLARASTAPEANPNFQAGWRAPGSAAPPLNR